jgi:hypothetical protein
MFVTSAGPDVLLNWFWYDRQHHFRFLVLLAAGDVGQAQFFEDVFNEKENLDIVSGHDIAIFLFGGPPKTLVSLPVSAESKLIVLPAAPGRTNWWP